VYVWIFTVAEDGWLPVLAVTLVIAFAVQVEETTEVRMQVLGGSQDAMVPTDQVRF